MRCPMKGVANWLRNRSKQRKYVDKVNRAYKVVDLVVENQQKVSELNDLLYDERQKFWDGMDSPVYASDPYTNELLYVNDALKKLFGDCVGQICHKVFFDSDTPCDFCTNKRLFEDGEEVVHWTFYNESCSGWFRLMDKKIHWPDGRMVRLEIAIDITDVKEAEKELREKEWKLQSLAEASYEAIAIHRGGEMMAVNKAFEELVGYTESELMEMPHVISTIFSADSAEAVKDQIRSKSLDFYQAVVHHKDGRDIPVGIKPNYVDYGNGHGECRVAAIVTHEWVDERCFTEEERHMV